MGYGGHPTPREIKLYVKGRAGPVDQLWIAEHIGYCTPCFRLLDSARRRPDVSEMHETERDHRRRQAG
jgi:hypothetical protein